MSDFCDRVRSLGLLLALVSTASTTACTTIAASDGGAEVVDATANVTNVETAEAVVAKRAQEHLDALRAGDWEKAWTYISPAYRQLTPRSRYASRYAGAPAWTAANVEKVACDGADAGAGIEPGKPERCSVTFMVSYRMARPRMENTRPLDSVWIPIDGQWYIYEQ